MLQVRFLWLLLYHWTDRRRLPILLQSQQYRWLNALWLNNWFSRWIFHVSPFFLLPSSFPCFLTSFLFFLLLPFLPSFISYFFLLFACFVITASRNRIKNPCAGNCPTQAPGQLCSWGCHRSIREISRWLAIESRNLQSKVWCRILIDTVRAKYYEILSNYTPIY